MGADNFAAIGADCGCDQEVSCVHRRGVELVGGDWGSLGLVVPLLTGAPSRVPTFLTRRVTFAADLVQDDH